jgi:ribosomal protein S18 acetylase RimI-like enzyme
MEKMKIRQATTNDLNEIIRIFIEGYAEKPYNEKWTKNIVKNKIKKYLKFERKLYLAQIDKKIVGFIIFSKNIWDDGDHLVIDELVIDSTFQGKGIEKRLMNFAGNYFKNIVTIDLWTFKRAKAYSIYKKWGYKDHKEGVMMYKKLK